jgi:hypothetical protein
MRKRAPILTYCWPFFGDDDKIHKEFNIAGHLAEIYAPDVLPGKKEKQ